MGRESRAPRVIPSLNASDPASLKDSRSSHRVEGAVKHRRAEVDDRVTRKVAAQARV